MRQRRTSRALVAGLVAGVAGLTATGAAAAADTTPPVITVPADLTVPATGPTGASAAFAASATDGVDGTDPVTCTPPSGSTFVLGATTVTCTATDQAGNPASKTFKVTVVDTTAPALTVPADLTVSPKSAGGAPVTFAATATDNVDAAVTVSCLPASGSTFPIGATTVKCTAADRAANVASKSFKVTVSTPTAPAITVPADRSLGADGPTGDVVTYTVTATDALDGTIPATCTPASGATFPIGVTTVTCTATNSAGRTATKSFGVTVQAPVSDQLEGTAAIRSVRTRSNLATVQLTCAGPDTTTCTVKLQLLGGAAVFRTRTVSLASGERKTVRLRLNRLGTARWRTAHRLAGVLRLSEQADSGRTSTRSRPVVFTH